MNECLLVYFMFDLKVIIDLTVKWLWPSIKMIYHVILKCLLRSITFMSGLLESVRWSDKDRVQFAWQNLVTKARLKPSSKRIIKIIADNYWGLCMPTTLLSATSPWEQWKSLRIQPGLPNFLSLRRPGRLDTANADASGSWAMWTTEEEQVQTQEHKE